MWSAVGYLGIGRPINQTIEYELLYTLGLFHQQSSTNLDMSLLKITIGRTISKRFKNA